jgi:hypothetical protein
VDNDESWSMLAHPKTLMVMVMVNQKGVLVKNGAPMIT